MQLLLGAGVAQKHDWLWYACGTVCVLSGARAHTDTAAMAALRTISPRQCLDLLTAQGGISKILEMIMRQQEM